MKFQKIKHKPKLKLKVSYTYYSPEHATALEYLTKYCIKLRLKKVDVLNEAFTMLFEKEKKYSKELNSKRFQEFKKKFGKDFIDKENKKASVKEAKN